MRLSDFRRDDAPLPAGVEEDLRALEAAERGEPDADAALATLVSDLRHERPEPSPGFGAELDAWAAAGFPRGRRPGARADARAGRARGFLDSLTPRRLSYAGGAAAALVVLVVAVSQVETNDADDGAVQTTVQQEAGSGQAAAPEARKDAASPAPGAVAPASTPEMSLDADRAVAPQGAASGGRAAAGQDVRRVERDAQLTLAAPADEVQGVTNEAIGVVERHRGVVLSSRSTGTEERASASLELMIPTRELDSALSELSDLADVKQLSEGSVDITRPYLDAKDELRGLRAERKSLIAQIQAATTEEELDRLTERHEQVLRRLARANARFDNVQRRARQSTVHLQITSDGASEGDWSFADALDDAGRVLTVAAGVLVISAAVLLPVAILAAIAYLLIAASRRRARDRALDD